MEMTTMSPSPASPTEGDDLFEIDVTNVAIHSVTLLICLCGLVGNGAVLCLYPLESCTYAMFHLAVTDLLFLLFMVPSAFLFLVEDMSCSTIVTLIYLNILFQLSRVSYYWVLYRLMFSSAAFDMSNLLQLCCRGNLPLRLLLVIDSVQVWAFFSLFTVIPMVTSLCPPYEQGQCRAALISMFFTILLLFVAPTVISRTMNIIKAKQRSKNPKPMRRHIVFSIIVLFTLLLIFCNFLQQIGYFPMPSEVFFLLSCIHCSIKPFIYILSGRCWSPCSMVSLRLYLQRVFEEKEEKTACSDHATIDTVI